MKAIFLGLRTAIYKVTDMAEAREWYSRVLDTRPYFDEPYYIGFQVGGYELGLQPADAGTVHGDCVLAYWGVADIEKTFHTLMGAGATPYEQPEEVGGGIKTAAVRDPWGNVFGIIENPHFGRPA